MKNEDDGSSVPTSTSLPTTTMDNPQSSLSSTSASREVNLGSSTADNGIDDSKKDTTTKMYPGKVKQPTPPASLNSIDNPYKKRKPPSMYGIFLSISLFNTLLTCVTLFAWDAHVVKHGLPGPLSLRYWKEYGIPNLVSGNGDDDIGTVMQKKKMKQGLRSKVSVVETKAQGSGGAVEEKSVGVLSGPTREHVKAVDEHFAWLHMPEVRGRESCLLLLQIGYLPSLN